MELVLKLAYDGFIRAALVWVERVGGFKKHLFLRIFSLFDETFLTKHEIVNIPANHREPLTFSLKSINQDIRKQSEALHWNPPEIFKFLINSTTKRDDWLGPD